MTLFERLVLTFLGRIIILLSAQVELTANYRGGLSRADEQTFAAMLDDTAADLKKVMP